MRKTTPLALLLLLALSLGERAAAAQGSAEPATPTPAADPARATSTSAPASDPAPAASVSHRREMKLGLLVGLKGNLGLPQPFSTLQTGGGLELEVGYLLPFLGRRLGLSLSASYGRHTASGEGQDARLVPDGTYQWDLTFQAMMLSVGVTGRIFPPFAKPANGYLTVGPRIFLLSMEEKAYSGDEAFGTSTEQDMRVGVFLAGGGEFYLGPGALFLEVEYQWVKVPGLIPGQADGSALRFALGYRILL